MHVVVVGASGNAGTSLLRALGEDPEVERVTGIARRRPDLQFPKTDWRQADITGSDLRPLFEGADAVVHLAWAIQPSHDPDALRAVNIDGSLRIFDAVSKARVPTLIYASSVGAYSPGPKNRTVDESWPTEGIPSSFYASHKAEVERLLDQFERGAPGVRVVRIRPALMFKREAATEIRRYFLGPFLPPIAFDRRVLAAVPDVDRLTFQAVHADDVAQAYRLAIHDENARGAYNLAAEPVLDAEQLAATLEARRLKLPARLLRGAAAATWRARLQPTPEGWVDMGRAVPLMSSTRARNELGWEPQHSADATLLELLGGLRDGAGLRTPPLDPASSGRLRINELRTAVGGRPY